tara:strand:- start:1412 stop:2440 length:1029 start_codon:yes stop_codon:yes gene_type:complete
LIKKIKITLIVFLLLIGCSQNGSEVNIYTSRHYDSDDELYALFTEKTGIQVNVISGKGAALIERIKAEGENSPADIYFTVDAGNLWKVQSEGFFQSISSNKINSIVPENLRGPNNEWIAIAKRARVIFYNPKKISKDEIKNLSYEDLSNPKWKGRIVIRSSNNMYNQSLVASLISNNGIENTEIWGKGLISNFARKPQGNDRSQIMAVANEEADLAIANSYYIGLMLSGTKGSEQLEAAKKVSIHFPNQNNRGAHINISGAGILKSSPNSKNAIKFLEFLLSEEMQKNIVNNSYEYPILENIDPHPLIKNFGTDFKEDRTSVTDYGELNPEAIKLMDRVGWK